MTTPLYILQHATGAQYEQLLTLAAPLWRAWSAKHGGKYVNSVAREHPERSPYWEKVAFLSDTLREIENGALVLMPDGADTLPRSPAVNPRFALPHGVDVGMVWSDVARCWNAGVWFLVNSAKVREWLDYIWELGPQGNENETGWEQASTNIALGYPLGKPMKFPTVGEPIECSDGVGPKVVAMRLDPKWNSYRWVHNTVWPPVIEAWHGEDKAKLLPIFEAARLEFDKREGPWAL